MKKIMSILFVAAVGMSSCKKEKHDTPAPGSSQPTLVKDDSFVSGVSMPPLTPDIIGQYIYKVGGMDGFVSAPDISFTGTLALSNVKKFFFTIKKKADGMVVFTSPIKATVTALYSHPSYIPLQKNTEYVIALYADIPGGAFGQLTTKIRMEYEWSRSTQSSWTSEAIGQTMTYGFPSGPKVTSNSVATTTVVNGVFMEMNTITVEAVASGSTAVKGLAWRNSFTNNSNAGVMRFDSLRLFFKGVDVTGQWIFVDSAGATVTSISQASVNSKKLFAVPITGLYGGIGEVTAGSSEDFSVWGVPKGFGGDSVISDVFSCMPLNDVAATPAGYHFLNKGTVGLNPKLFNSPQASSSAKVAHFVWSPMTYTPFSAGYGAQCPNWYSSYGLTFTVTSTILQSRQRR